MSGNSKRKSTTESEAGSFEAKIPKLNLGTPGGKCVKRKERLVASSLYKVAKSYPHNHALGTKFAVTKGQVVQFIRYGEAEADGSECVEVMERTMVENVLPSFLIFFI